MWRMLSSIVVVIVALYLNVAGDHELSVTVLLSCIFIDDDNKPGTGQGGIDK